MFTEEMEKELIALEAAESQTRPEEIEPEYPAWGELAPVIELSKYVLEDNEDGKLIRYTALDLVDDAESLYIRKQKLERDTQTFSQNFFRIAGLCSSSVEFYALCEDLERRKHWGRYPKDTDPKERSKWVPAPDTWKVYKSTIGKAWQDYNIKPGEKYHVLTHSQEELGPIVMDIQGINQLKKLVTIEKARKERQGDEYAPHVDGVIVLRTGEQRPVHTPKEATPKEGASVGAALPALDATRSARLDATRRQSLDTDIATLLGTIANMYGNVPEDMQTKVKDRLTRLVRDMEVSVTDMSANAVPGPAYKAGISG